jgi:subtilisin family serine protease
MTAVATADASTARAGRGVRVAIVDSGVERTHPWLVQAKLTHFALRNDGKRWVVEPSVGVDASGHGTACAGIIHRLVPEAELVDVRVLDADARCVRDALLAAIRYCIVQRFDVVNLSLGVDVPRSAPLRPTDYPTIVDLYELADAAYTRGVVLVAAGPNLGAFRTYPGKFKSLIGVGRAAFDDPEALRTELTADYELVAPGEKVSAPALGGGKRLWTGTSFATPHVVAHVARIRAERPGLSIDATKATLHALAASWKARRA